MADRGTPMGRHGHICIAETMLSQDVCPSVCPTDTRRYFGLLMVGINDEAYHKKHQRYAEDNVTRW